jgi:hypothetical protein
MTVSRRRYLTVAFWVLVVALFFAFRVLRHPFPTAFTPPGPTFTVADSDLHPHTTFIAYGDMRFTDPSDTKAANPWARRELVARIAELQPDAVQVSGDIPYAGGRTADYDVYRRESEPWRTAHLRIYPALGNHEFARCFEATCLDNWWKTFPELRGMRWYSVALGSRMYLINLDSISSLTDGSPQRAWLADQIDRLPKTVDFVMISLHHPPVADYLDTPAGRDHNPRPNEIALRDYLNGIAPKIHAAIVVTAGHIHNYERFEQNGVLYLVSGGGGAHPLEVERTPADQYRNTDFPNFHYIVFTLEKDELDATMYRLTDPKAAVLEWQARDSFVAKKK